MKKRSNINYKDIPAPRIVPNIDALKESLNPSPTDERYKKKTRTCLSCGREFMSKSCGHRFCKRCRPKLDTHAGSVPVIKTFGEEEMNEVEQEGGE